MKYAKFLIICVSIAVVVVITVAAYRSYNQNKDCSLINDQSTREDCYHSLAHADNDRKICDKIVDSEKKEHCFDHVPD